MQRALALARTLDAHFVDPIVGLILPGAGDLLAAGVGVYIVVVAVRKGLPAGVIARMLLNLAIDLGIGAIPGVGDVADFFYRANSKNARLLVEREPGSSTARDWMIVCGAVALFVLALAIPIALLVVALKALFG